MRLMQELFRNVVKHCMDGNLPEFQTVLQSLLDNQKDPNVTIQELVSEFHSEGKTILHIACSSGKELIVQHLLSRCSDPAKLVNLKDNQGFTPLINATVSESTVIMKELIGLGADVNAQNNDGATALHFAAGDGNLERMALLCAHGAKVNYHSKSGTPLHWAAGKGLGEAIAFLIAKGVDVNEVSTDGIPPVLMAAATSSDLGVKALVEAGADVGLIVSGNLTALHICAEHGLDAAVAAIVKTETGKKCCELETAEGNKPIHLAAMADLRHTVKTLLPHSKITSMDASKWCSMSEEDQLDFLMNDGKKRMNDWERKHNKQTEEGSASASSSGSVAEMPTSVAYFDSITNPAPSAATEAEAEQHKESGNELFKNKANKEALAAYTEAIEINKFNATYWSNRSAVHLALKNYQQALIDAEIARRLKPDWPKACYRLAAARLALNQFEDAAVAAFEGCKLDPDNKELKVIMNVAVKKGQEAHKESLKK